MLYIAFLVNVAHVNVDVHQFAPKRIGLVFKKQFASSGMIFPDDCFTQRPSLLELNDSSFDFASIFLSFKHPLAVKISITSVFQANRSSDILSIQEKFVNVNSLISLFNLCNSVLVTVEYKVSALLRYFQYNNIILRYTMFFLARLP